MDAPVSTKRLTASDLRAALGRVDFSNDDLRDACNIVTDSTQFFDFGTGDAPADADLIADLWQRKLLRPPYDRCVFMYRYNACRIYLLASYNVSVVTAPDETYDGATVLIAVSQYGEQTRAEALSWFVATKEPGQIMAGGIPLVDCDGETAETFRSFSLWTVGKFMRYCMALNTKGIRQRHEPQPHKLNKKRAQSGKPPIPAVTYVDLARAVAHGHGGGSGKGGTKATHWRRGHIRHYDDGSVTWVRDCIIKADGELKARERYQVQKVGPIG